MKIKYLFSSMIIVTIFLTTHAHADNAGKHIVVSDAWVQAMPPSQTTTAAYMTITNNSKKEATLSSASTDIAGATEIHQMSDMNGMMHMAMLADVRIPAMGKLKLQPSQGFHLMLIHLKKPANKGDIVPITLHFRDGSSIMVNADVRDQ